MDIKLRDEALTWIRQVADIIVDGTRQIDPDTASAIERETTRYLDEMKSLSSDALCKSGTFGSPRPDAVER